MNAFLQGICAGRLLNDAYVLKTPGRAGRQRGHSAKELGIALAEAEGPNSLTCLDHALDLGRELQKAEFCVE